ncbi:MAG: WD40 repeat domain-containing protein, partial [Gemmataceae bacterium]
NRLCHDYLFTTEPEKMSCVAFAPDGQQIVTGNAQGKVQIWALGSDQPVHSLEGFRVTVASLQFHPDGSKLLGLSGAGKAIIWNVKTGAVLHSLEYPSPAYAACYNPAGEMFAVLTNRFLALCDAESGKTLGTISMLGKRPVALCFSPNGKWIAVLHAPNVFSIWEAKTGKQVKQLNGPPGAFDACFSPDGRQLVIASHGNGLVNVWDTETWKERTLFKLPLPMYLFEICYSPDGKHLALALSDRTVQIWNAATGQRIRSLQGHTDQVRAVRYSPDGTKLASVSLDGTVKIWAAERDQDALVLKTSREGVYGCAFSPDGKRLASASPEALRVSDPLTGELLGVANAVQHAMAVRFSPDGTKLACFRADRNLYILDAATGNELVRLEGHTQHVRGLCFSPDGKWLASGSVDNTAKIWDTVTGKVVREWQFPEIEVVGLAFNPDGTRLAVTGGVRQFIFPFAVVFDAADGRKLFELKGHKNVVCSVCFSPDGQHIVTGCNDHNIRVFSAEDGHEVRPPLIGHGDFVSSLSFSPDGQRLASGSWDRSVRIWDLENGQEVLILKGHSEHVNDVCFSPDGKLLASCDGIPRSPGTVRIWAAPGYQAKAR